MNKRISITGVLSCLLSIFIILLPFEEALASSAGTILKMIGILISAICIIVAIKEDKIKLNIIQVLVSLWIVFGILSYFWSSSTYWWIYFSKTYINLILMFIAITIVPAKYYKIDLIKKSLIIGALIASIIIIISPNASHFTDEGRRTIMLFGTVLDPNVVCAIISLGIFASLNYLIEIKSKRVYKKYIVCIFVMLLGVLFTGSRGGLLSVGVIFIVWILLNFKSSIPKRYIFIILISIVFVVVITISIIPEELISTRFTFENLIGLNEIKTGAHSRYKIWSFVPNLFFESPFVGYGLGNFMQAMAGVYKSAASHNMYLLLLIEGGLFGALLFIIAIIITIKKLYKNKLYNDLCIFMLVLMICLSLDGIMYKFLWVTWAIVIISLKELKEKNG